jgi:hypothetical protein
VLAFGIADNHGHVVALCRKKEALDLARRIEQSLQRQFCYPIAFAEVDHEIVSDLGHLTNVFWYVLEQDRRHKLNRDLAFEGTNLPDLLGMRLTGAYALELQRSHLPRINRSDLLRCLKAPDLAPADGPIEDVVEAVCRAYALPDIRGLAPERIRARRTALALIDGRLTKSASARLLGIERTTVYRLCSRPVDPVAVQAARWQLALINRLRQKNTPAPIAMNLRASATLNSEFVR